MNDELPQRPLDLIGSLLYDAAYGSGSKNNPLLKVVTQLEKLNEVAKSFSTFGANITEMNKALKETSNELKETNRLLRELTQGQK